MTDTMIPAMSPYEPPSEPPVRLSVVIPVLNRADSLRRMLQALAAQAFPREQFEAVVCDDGSSVDLAPVVAEAVERFGLRVRYARQLGAGAGKARNLGIALARGEVIAFTDSDCVPDPGWLLELDRAFDDPAVGLVGGRVDGRGAEHLSGRCVNFLMSSALGSGGARDPRALIRMDYYPRTCNLAVRRALAVAVGGFPSAVHGEDLEFSHRLREAGAGVRFLPAAVVVHDERRALPAATKEAFLKGQTRVQLARRLSMHQLIHTLPATFVVYLAVLTAVLAVGGRASVLLLAPGLSYMLVLAVLAVQGFVTVGGVDVLCLIPVYAAAIHLGYGLGYLTALPDVFRRPPSPGLAPACRPDGDHPLGASLIEKNHC